MSKKNFSTEQEKFWAGQFGEDYLQRNTKEELLAKNLWFFTNALKRVDEIESVIEFGPNIGANLLAIQNLFPNISLAGIEINHSAIDELKRNIPNCLIHSKSILEYEEIEKYDLVLIKGVLIHQDPSVLEKVYQKLFEASKKYILIAEYYDPNPVELDYRGNSGKLFKRDFAGEFLDIFPDCILVDYGFAYRNEKKAPQDDITWFLLEKKC